MPKYNYKCTACGRSEVVPLPISHDPSMPIRCPDCSTDTMTRRVGANHYFIANTRRTLGKWYKENTGKELLSGE